MKIVGEPVMVRPPWIARSTQLESCSDRGFNRSLLALYGHLHVAAYDLYDMPGLNRKIQSTQSR